MLIPVRTTKFKRDWKRVVKRGHNMEALQNVMTRLARQEILARKYFDHKLVGRYSGRRCCHVEPDLLFIYKLALNENEIVFERVGSHADLFGL